MYPMHDPQMYYQQMYYQQMYYQQRWQEKQHRKYLRRQFNPVGWTLVIYYIIMNVAVLAVMLLDGFLQVFETAVQNPMLLEDEQAVMDLLMRSMSDNAWGYMIPPAVGLFVLLVWKGKGFWSREIWSRGRAMTAGAFFGILSVFLGVQLAASIMSTALETILNVFGLSMMSVVESASGSSDSFSMFLYASIVAPITEELLFRGYVLRTLRPHGKKFAILCSAAMFGLFHGNLYQTPYAFLVGLVLGYVAVEYNIGWAMVLHMINNMVLADMLSRLTANLPGDLPVVISGLVILGFGIAAVIILAVNHRKIGAYLRQERMDGRCLKCFFGCAGVITLTVMMLLNLILLITPL